MNGQFKGKTNRKEKWHSSRCMKLGGWKFFKVQGIYRQECVQEKLKEAKQIIYNGKKYLFFLDFALLFL